MIIIARSMHTMVIVLLDFILRNRKPLFPVVLLPAVFFMADAARSEEPSAIENYLSMDFSQLMEISVSSVSKREQALGEIAAAVYVITSEDISRSGVTTVADALALAPGIHVAKISSSKWSVSARGFAGFSSNKLLVLIDGRSVYSPLYSGTIWDMNHTLLEDIERIEVIRGPGGTIWGSNAVNGVINIITKPAEQTQQSLVRISAGNEERYSAATRVGWQPGKAVFGRIYALAEGRDSYRLAESGGDGGDEWNSVQSGFRIDGSTNEKTTFNVQGDIQKNNGDQRIYPDWKESGNFVNWETGDFSPSSSVIDLDTLSANILTRLEHTWPDARKISLQMYFDHSSRDEEILNFTTDTLDFDLQYEFHTGEKQLLTLGSGYRYIDSSFDNNYKYSVTDSSNDMLTAFIQDEIKSFSDRLISTFGVKYEHNDFTGSEWQPSARILWKPIENQSVWAAVSKAVRTPSFIEDSSRILLSVIPGTDSSGNPVIDPETGTPAEVPVFLTGSSSFSSETLYAFELGHRWQASRELTTDIALFYNQYKDIYSFLDDGSSPVLTMANALEAHGYGIETVIKWQPYSWLSLEADYTLQQLVFEETATSHLTGEVIENTTPSQIIDLRGTLVPARQWQVNAWLRWQDATATKSPGEMYMDWAEIDPFFTLNATVVWNPRPGLEIMLAGQNLLESGRLQYISEFSTPATEIERSVFMKVTWEF